MNILENTAEGLCSLNPFKPSVPFLCPMKKAENLWGIEMEHWGKMG